MVTVYPRRNKHDGSTESNCLIDKRCRTNCRYEFIAAPSIRSRSPFNWKTPKNKDVSGWLDNSYKLSNFPDYSLERAKTRIDNNYPRVSFNREGVLKSRSPSGERASAAWEQDKFKRNKPSSSSHLPKLKLSFFDGNTLE